MFTELYKPQVAIIGAGRWGRNIIRTLTPLANIHTIVHNGTPETTNFLSADYPYIVQTADYHSVLADPAIECVFIATPMATHANFAREALSAGKHVFVEKPLSLSTETIDELYALASAQNRTLFTGYMYIYDPAFLMLKNELQRKQLFSVNTLWTKFGTFDSPLPENLLVHELALCHELLGLLTPRDVPRNEKNVFHGSFVGERGTAHIFIDREQQEKQKTLTVHTDTVLYTLTVGKLTAQDLVTRAEKILYENTSAPLLEIELQNFLAETTHGAKSNQKRQILDSSIAFALKQLS